MANGHGGKRPGAGRKRRPAFKEPPGKLQPLELMLERMRDKRVPMPERIEIAVKAAPYVHPRLQAITAEVDGEVTIELVSYLESPNPSD